MKPLNERHMVVLVDDEPAVLAALRRSLSREPYLLLATDRPDQALCWVERMAVSAVVSDERMPDMTGCELLARVSDRSPVTARIILTAYGGPTAQLPRLGRSIECMIAKPWDDRMLRLALREIMAERETLDPGRENDFERQGAK